MQATDITSIEASEVLLDDGSELPFGGIGGGQIVALHQGNEVALGKILGRMMVVAPTPDAAIDRVAVDSVEFPKRPLVLGEIGGNGLPDQCPEGPRVKIAGMGCGRGFHSR